MSQPFTLLWGSILRSSLWVTESKETRIVWITLLALRDAKGIVRSSLIGLAHAARLTIDECKAALERLMSPDPNDTSGIEEGRRIRQIEGGWQIINHDKYRFSTEEKRELWKQQKAAQRSRKKKTKPLPGQAQYDKAVKRDATQEELDDITRRSLPEQLQESPPPYTPTPLENHDPSHPPEEPSPTSKCTIPPALQGKPALL